MCLNNLRQIGIGIRLYQNDNNGKFPLRISRKGSLGTPPESMKENRDDWRFFDVAIGGTEPAHPSPQIPRAAERPLFNYLKNGETFHCPFDKGWDFRPEGELVAPTAFVAHGCSYQYNTIKTAREEPLGLEGIAGKTESWVPDPSIYILMYEPSARVQTRGNSEEFLVFWHWAQNATTLRAKDYKSQSGSKKRISPILFVDGHSAIVNFKEWLGNDGNTTEWTWAKREN
ncbi:MAG: hypothetical protein JWQ71_2319 [Pedosphaera sp.]|nr:hypothetical protein [Pedosphaera sp.]